MTLATEVEAPEVRAARLIREAYANKFIDGQGEAFERVAASIIRAETNLGGTILAEKSDEKLADYMLAWAAALDRDRERANAAAIREVIRRWQGA